MSMTAQVAFVLHMELCRATHNFVGVVESVGEDVEGR